MMTFPSTELILINAFEWTLLASLKTIPLIALVLGLQKLFSKYFSAKFRHLLWTPILASLVIPFGWSVGINPFTDDRQNITVSTPSVANAVATHSLPLSENTNTNLRTTHNFLFNTPNENALTPIHNFFLSQKSRLIASVFWLSGMIFLLTYTLIEVRRYRGIKTRSHPASVKLQQLYETCRLRINADISTRLLCSNEIQTPIAIGWIKPSIIIPKGIAENILDERLTYIFLHELAHIKRRDILFNWLTSLITIAHWFNPFVWLASRNIQVCMEIACDALVLDQLPKNQHKIYGETLVELSVSLNTPQRALTTLGILENHTELVERLKMIKQFTHRKTKGHTVFGLLFLVIGIAAFAQPSTQMNAADLANDSTIAQSIELKNFAEQAEKILNTTIFVGQDNAEQPVRVKVDSNSFNYKNLLSQLKINGFTAIKSAGHINIIRLNEIRYAAVPVVAQDGIYYDDEYVTEYVQLKKACSAELIPSLRPMIPTSSHVSLNHSPESLVITDSYGNIQRIKAVINAIENNLEAPKDCSQARLPKRANN